MKLITEDKNIEEEKDLLTFLEKYFNAGNPATTNCTGGCRRSISDLHDLYKNYNPKIEVTYEDIIVCLPLLKITRKNYFTGEPLYISIRYCDTPKKVVIFTSNKNFSNWDFFKEYNMNILLDSEENDIIGKDGISINNVLAILKENYG